MRSSCSWIGTFLFILASSLFVLYGFMNQSKLLQANKCKMTYSQPHFERIDVNSQIKEFQLFIHGSVKDVLNPSPVLFIPGNSGSAKQVRSFASPTHNGDERFQYFALHFEHSMSATHGSETLKQAAFLNDAISAILVLYRSAQSNNANSVDVLLLAHSAGGLVARTALLLSNHPHLSVSSIIMIGSPNSRPTYTPDASLDLLYKKVNLAWRRSMYHTTPACKTAALLAKGVMRGEVPDFLGGGRSFTGMEKVEIARSQSDNETAVEGVEAFYATWECSINVPRTRVISISGGEIDMEVPSYLTPLHSLAPRPQNISVEEVEPKRLSYFLKPKGGYARYIFTSLIALPRLLVSPITGLANGLFEYVVGSKVSSDQLAGSTNSSSNSSSVSTDGGNGDNKSSSNSTGVKYFKRMEDITQEHWDVHVMPYLEPQHFSVRTSQLAGVGFPVDHKALLWCHQVVQTTTRVMSRLVESSPDVWLSEASLSTKIMKLKSSYALPTWPERSSASVCEDSDETCAASESESVTPIAPVQAELIRNVSRHLFSRVALDDERRIFLEVLVPSFSSSVQGSRWTALTGSLSVLSLAVVTSHLPTILTCYVAISLLIIATFVLYHIALKSKWNSHINSRLYSSQGLFFDLALLIPGNHLFLSAFADVSAMILPSSISSFVFFPKKESSAKLVVTFVVIVLVMVRLFFLVLETQSPIDFVRYRGWYVEWIVSYGAALAAHIFVLVAVYFIRFIVNSLYFLLCTLARYSIWCKPIRQFVRPRTRSLQQSLARWYESYVPAIEWIILVFLLSAILASLVFFGQQSNISSDMSSSVVVPHVSRVIQVSSMLFLLSYAIFAMVFIAAVIWPPVGSSRMLTTVISMYLPVMFLVLPTKKFCREIFSTSHDSVSTVSALSVLIDAFGPDLINYACGVMFMSLNLLYLYRYEINLQPVAFLYEAFEVSKKVRVAESSGEVGINLFSLFSSSGSSSCLHEDGGVLAVFEDNRKGVSSFSRGSVLAGPAFRVLSCDCSLDKNLKSFGEWCEWCRCDSCGGKAISINARNLAGAKAFNASNADSSARNALGMRDISSDLLVLVSLLASVLYVLGFSSTEPFQHTYALGVMSAALVIARVIRYIGY